MKRALALTAVLIAGIAAIALADAETTKPAEEPPAPQPITRCYDIRDLLGTIPDFSAPDMSADQPSQSGGSSSSEARGLTQVEVVDQLIKTIVDTIAPDSWRDAGGAIGMIQERQGVLTITQTAENHKQIEAYLSEFRKVSTLQPVRIRAHWILTRRSDLTPMLKPLQARQSKPAAAGDQSPASSALLAADDSDLDKIAGAVHFRGEILCMSGQRVYVMASNKQSENSGTLPGGLLADGAAAMNQVGSIVLEARNSVSVDRASVMLTLFSQCTRSAHSPAGEPQVGPTTAPTTVPASGTDAPGATAANTATALHELKTTVSLPVGKTILIGGMTLDPASHGSRPADHAGRQGTGEEPEQLYLFVEVTAG